ncbi:hypothetical protein KZZ08_23145 [Roseovarius mucosus]|uniref:hypothetical protein n=1 Tax=Roseovarius mucosus TaxID=215743 RepID=UPI001C5D18D5|nr:hypothetical protein [Roseovarius mucosus]MBW4976502.1 hypothetical protein [Roseovarius mucosus]
MTRYVNVCEWSAEGATENFGGSRSDHPWPEILAERAAASTAGVIQYFGNLSDLTTATVQRGPNNEE